MDDRLERVTRAGPGKPQTLYVEAPHGSGKREALVGRVRALVTAGASPGSILVLVPQRQRREMYGAMICDLGVTEAAADGSSPEAAATGRATDCQGVVFHTFSSLASRMVRLFWPLVAEAAGFADPHRPPVFLTYETAQYLMGQLVAPQLERGYFERLSMRPQRVLSQLLDNLNKAAINGYPVDEVRGRLEAAWTGERARLVYYEQVQTSVRAFRDHCLRHGLLDFSLVIEVFHQYLLEVDGFWAHLTGWCRHLLVDQLEETVPVAQDLIRRLIDDCESACLFADPRGGFRVFMGIDSRGAKDLAAVCSDRVVVEPRTRDPVSALGDHLGQHLGGERRASPPAPGQGVAGLIFTRGRADMLAQVAAAIVDLVNGGIPPGDIAVVAPHADGVLRCLLGESLDREGIPFAVVRRFESLREQRPVRVCLTLAALAHPSWGVRPHPYDVAETLAVVAGLDPVRGALAAQCLYAAPGGDLRPARTVDAEAAGRVGSGALAKYEAARIWLCRYAEETPVPLDHFFRRVFGELLSGPSLSSEDAAAYARLITSGAWFRQAAASMGLAGKAIGQRYVEMVWDGVVSAERPGPDPGQETESVVLVSPVHTYLSESRQSVYQFWLDLGSTRWWEPPHQPLTNPHVLSRSWTAGSQWTDAVDFEIRNQTLRRLVHGLCSRCRRGVYLCSSELEEGGEAQDSPLLRAVERALREGD